MDTVLINEHLIDTDSLLCPWEKMCPLHCDNAMPFFVAKAFYGLDSLGLLLGFVFMQKHICVSR